MDNPLGMQSSKQLVLQTICYFDIFHYPLRLEEIFKFTPGKIDSAQLTSDLEQLVSERKIRKQNDFYFLKDTDASCLNLRIKNEKNLLKENDKIKKYATLVSGFPFVEAVFISGSVSKGVLSSDGDVDYFIVARKGRVWFCRSLLIVFKKLILLNSKKYFCVNYFIDSGNLKVPDANLFVATEIKTLIPVRNNSVVEQFYIANKWADEILPNAGSFQASLLSSPSLKLPHRFFIEKICAGKLGDLLDNYFFRITLKRWKQKFPTFNKTEFDLNMRSYKNVSKHHPQGNQGRVLSELERRMEKLR
ncbi:MAG: nucleotidyltransferase, partial [Bacteroidetes bacterium]|nr:nucleotidyltransferase [Bacteroidota bacterium]